VRRATKSLGLAQPNTVLWGSLVSGLQKYFPEFCLCPLRRTARVYIFSPPRCGRLRKSAARRRIEKKILQEKQNKALTDADNVGYHVGPTETTVARDEHLTVRCFLRKNLSEVVN
jgi:hypothetical protein